MNAMNDELPRIQEQVYYGHISSHTDVLEKFLSESGINRYNPQVKYLKIFKEMFKYALVTPAFGKFMHLKKMCFDNLVHIFS